jgi:hypothetical protein
MAQRTTTQRKIAATRANLSFHSIRKIWRVAETVSVLGVVLSVIVIA